MLGPYGWSVLAIEDGIATVAANTGQNGDLAASVRDWLTNADRITTLLERHGLVDVPLEDLEAQP